MGHPSVTEEDFEDKYSSYRVSEKIPRHDPFLVEAVEYFTLHDPATVEDLSIEEIYTPAYRIDEYDGLESVVVPNVEEFTFIKPEDYADYAKTKGLPVPNMKVTDEGV
jgi:hypothetical protein